ncbi:MAG: polysaccharide biosynthesis tyrosine autokinase [Clostridiales bacterium]|nr:polysaccharide biosynthesis tyrosine autokinase [Clostridiales bacterium]
MEKILFRHIKEQNYTLKESLRALRTNLQFCGDDVRAILFTSAAPDEGKSTVVMDLARSLTDAKKNVLLIDADIRKSVLIGRMNAKTESGSKIYGLSHYLSGQKKMSDVVYTTEIPRLYMVFSGPSVPNPTEILDKKYFEDLINFGKEYFDYVLIDCPPIGAAIDAAVIAKYCDGAVLVTAQGQVSSRIVQNAKKQLEVSGVRILGAVLNKVNMKKNSYYGKYYGKYYGSYYGNDSDGKKKK